MSKFVTLNYYRQCYSKDNTSVCYGDGSIYKPFTITLNIDSIMSIADKPCVQSIFKSYEDRNSSEHSYMNVYGLGTNAGVGLGLNGVDFKFYYITKESYHKLITALDPIQCNPVPLRYL